jgi:hypothetical protein
VIINRLCNGNDEILNVFIYCSLVWPSVFRVVTVIKGHAITQAVSCRLQTAAAWVRAQVTSCGICGR